MYAAAKHLDSFGQVGSVWQCDQRLLLVAHLFDVPQRNRLSFASLLGQLVEGGDVFLVRVCEADYEEEVRVEVAVVEGAGRVACVLAVTQQDDVRSAVLDQNLRM